jgi:hypothetical protein
MTLTDFLLARIAEDEAYGWALAHGNRPGLERPGFGIYNPSRVLAECEAKRRIVEMAKGSPDFLDAMPRPGYAQPYHSPSVDVLIRVQQLLALPYADHPDYREEWRP